LAVKLTKAPIKTQLRPIVANNAVGHHGRSKIHGFFKLPFTSLSPVTSTLL